MGKTRVGRIGVEVWRFLWVSEWSRSAFFVNLLERSGVGVTYQILKSKPKMTLTWNVILTSLLFSQTLKSSGSDSDWSGV